MKHLLLLFIFAITANISFGQENGVRPYPMDERAILWKIEGNGIEKPSYLLGTVHLIEESHFFFPKKLKKIVGKSEMLTMEIAGIPEPGEAMEMMMLDEGSFFDYFTESQTDSILNWVEENTDFSPELFKTFADKMRPFVVSQLLIQLRDLDGDLSMEGMESYELELQKIAEAKEIEVQGLETIEEQLGFFDLLPREEHVNMVMEVVRMDSTSTEKENEIIELYDQQDIDGLYKLLSDGAIGVEGAQQLLIDNRNSAWIPKIEEMIAEQRTFIAVGAGHLGGPNGVLRLLEKEGYTLTPVEL